MDNLDERCERTEAQRDEEEEDRKIIGFGDCVHVCVQVCVCV